MNKCYAIFALDIKDPAVMREYVKAAREAITSEVKILAVNAPEVVEGKWYGQQTVIMEFENIAAAREWYQSPVYQNAVSIRHAAAEAKVAFVEGIDVQAFAESTPESVLDLIGDRF
ncbi:DUF1330 domain-containing protein [Amycolatopsis sp. NBC_00345]|uniref:DUF1330 domain-containing protein n=1 Tax=Amycolatopsis sp. NBC_00345 TaxID=2975955 RepID=UPI002E25A13B